MLNIYLEFFKSDAVIMIGKYLLVILPIVLPIMFLYTLWVIRFRWLTMKYLEKQKPCLLEIRLPKEITKSPAAMEIFFSHLEQGGAGNYSEAFLDGKTRPWFSCEIVSTGGFVRFFVWCSEEKFRNIVEAQLYAQFPNLEIFEAEDYTKDFYFDPEKYQLAAVQYTLTKGDVFPIKTYIDYGLDEDQKDEYKIDPLTSVLEYMGALKQGENAWIQIMLQKHEPESWLHGKLTLDVKPDKANLFQRISMNLFGKSKSLKDEVKEEIQKIKESTLTIPEKGSDEKIMKFPNPTKGNIEIIAALERSASKAPFDCMIRSVYIAEKAAFLPVNVGGLIGGLKQFGSNNLNGFKPGGKGADITKTQKDLLRVFPFLKKRYDKKISTWKKGMLYSYKLRSFFQWPYKNYRKTPPFVLTTEELATLFHFPSGMVSQTPTLKRVTSKKSEAPSNLPI